MKNGLKHAILMTVYKDPVLINKLIDLYPDTFFIFIHIDLKSDVNENDIQRKKNVKVFKKYKTNWGGVNHCLAMLFLLNQALKEEADYYHFVTGQDLPLNPYQFDKKITKGYSYLEYFKIPRPGWDSDGMWRYKYYNFYDILNAKNPKHIYLIRRLLHLQMKLHLVRPFRNYKNLYAGSGYCSLYYEHAKLVNNEAPKLINFYTHTFCAEESIFQTILIGIHKCNNIINDNLRYIDWSVPNPPKILSSEDIDTIPINKDLFCRKIDSYKSLDLIEFFSK